MIPYAGVAQSVEQRIRNAQAAGSNPITSSNFRRYGNLPYRLFVCFGRFLSVTGV